MVHEARREESEAPVAPGFAGRPVDLVHLARQTLGDCDLEREVLQLFAVHSRIHLARLRQAVDADSWRNAAHMIKGSACGIGAWGVARGAECAEHLDFDPKAVALRQAIALLEDEIENANRFIRLLFTSH